MGVTQRDVMGGRWEGGSCLGTHVRIKDFKIKKIKKNYVSESNQINLKLKKNKDTHGNKTNKNGSSRHSF